MNLTAPLEYLQADPAERDRACNGCGTKGLGGWITPDTLYGLSITEACNIHDWQYFYGRSILDKKAADRTFLNNLVRIVDAAPRMTLLDRILAPLRRRRALKYYEAVRHFGGPAFWEGKHS